MMAHFMEVDEGGHWRVRTACLDMIPNAEGHTHAVVRTNLISTLAFYEIEPLCVVTDNGSNLRALSSSEYNDVLSDIPHLRCLAHVVQLIVKDILRFSYFSDVLQEVECVVAPFRSRRLRTTVVEYEAQRTNVPAAQLDPGCAPTTCCTRWNGDFNLLDHFCRNKEKYFSLVSSRACDTRDPSGPHLLASLGGSAECLLRLLRPLADVTSWTQYDTQPMLGSTLCCLRGILAEWGQDGVLSEEVTEMRKVWRKSTYEPSATSSVSQACPVLPSASPQSTSRLAGRRSREKRARREHDESPANARDPGTPRSFPYACRNKVGVLATASNSCNPKDLYVGFIGATRPDGSVKVYFIDGDVEDRPASEVLVLKYRGKSNVPLTEVYADRANPSRRVHQPPVSLISPDFLSSWNSDIVESNSECESEEQCEVGAGVGPTGEAAFLTADMIDWLPEAASRSVASDHPWLLRRAAAHLAVLAGPALRLENEVCAMSLYFCPVSANTAFHCWTLPEWTSVRECVRAALVRLLAERLLMVTGLVGNYDETADGHSPDETQEVPVSLKVTLQRVCRRRDGARGNLHHQPETLEARCKRIVSTLMETYEDAVGVGSRSSDAAATDALFRVAAHTWWGTFSRTYALARLQSVERDILLSIIQAHLAVPASSASCERSFSIVTRARSTRPVMKPDLMRFMVFSKCNSWLEEVQ